jgi:RNA polymerase sigma-70 factor (ECF subfamily)
MKAKAEARYKANQRGLFRYFVRAVGHVETARDLTQDVFVRVSRSVIPAAPEAALRGWLFQIARNLALDHYRSGQRRPQAEPLTDTAARPASQDTSAQVNEALASLADVDRDVFLMREVAGLGYDEIATACGLTADAVRSRIHRARLQLRDRLSSQIAERQRTPMRRSGRIDPNALPSGTLPLTTGANKASAGRAGGGALARKNK